MTSATPKNEYVTDTMGLVLWIERRRLGARAKAVFKAAEERTAVIHVPALVVAEDLYLAERKRIRMTLDDRQGALIRFPHVKEYPLSLQVVKAAAEITDIRELHDRLIAATARLLGLQLVSNDPAVQSSSFVETVW
jgi:predicted nucleic acid-binding protein